METMRASYNGAMATHITLKCDRCGAPTQGETWISCSSCGTVCGFDFTRWLDSDAWIEFTRKAMADPQGYQQRWARHEAALQEAAVLARAGKSEAALERAAAEADWVFGEHPLYLSPQAKADRELRKRYARWVGFEMLQQRMAGPVAAGYAKLNEATRALGFGANENPMPAVEAMLAALREIHFARKKLRGPPDPEGLGDDARLRVASSQLLSSYVRMISPEHQAQVLRMIYGEGAISEQGAKSHDYSIYFDWECPRCGLFSLQAHGTEMLTCLGCYCSRRFDLDALKLNALAQPCPSCGARVDFAQGQTDATCAYCTTTQRRFACTGAAQRLFSREVRQQIAAQHGLPMELPEQEGSAVTPENRNMLQAEGLARMAQFFHPFITPARLRGLARASSLDASRVFALALPIVQREGPPEALKLLRAAAEGP